MTEPQAAPAPANPMARAYYGPYSIRDLNLHETHDGYAYACWLLKDGRRVARVEHSGTGGPPLFRWMSQDECHAFEAFAKKLPPVHDGGMVLRMDAELLIEQLVERQYFIDSNHKALTAHIAFQVGREIGTDTFRFVKGRGSKPVYEAIRGMFSEPVFILNEDLE